MGGADFAAMDRLDADDEPLRCSRTRKTASRDIVQFVPFRKFRTQGAERLAMEVLAEVPEQLIGYMRSKGIVPNAPPAPEAVDMSALAGAPPPEAMPPGSAPMAEAPPAYTGGGAAAGGGAAGGAAVVAATVVPVPQTETVNVQVPAGVVAGQMLQVQSPTTGKVVNVMVPEGVQPGQTLQVQI